MNQKVIKSGLWYTVSNFLIKSIGIITTPIFTRLLTKQVFGLYNNFSSWMSVLSIIVTLNLASTFISARFDFETDFNEYILSVLSLSSLSAMIWMLFLNVFSDFFVNLLGINQIYINIMMIYFVFSPAIDMFQAKERFFYGYKKTVFISWLITVSTAFISVLLVIFLPDKLFGRIVGSVIPTIIVGAILYVIIAKNGKKVRLKYWKYALPICLPYIPHLLSLTVLNSVDRIMITDICGPEESALYSLAYICGSVITVLVTSLNSAFSPWLGEKLNENKLDEIKSISKYYIFLFLALAVGLMLVSPEIILILGGKSYVEAKYVMPPVMSGCVFQFLYTMFVNIEQYKRKTFGMALASISSALFNFILNYIFIPKYGYIAAAYTTLASYLWLLITHMLLVKHIHYNEAYQYQFIVTTIIFTFIITIAITVLYSFTFLRYIIVGLYGSAIMIVLIKNYKKIIMIFKNKA